APPQAAAASQASYAEPQASQSGHADENEDDFSVEDYMSRLMARIQGQTSAPPLLYHPLEKDPPAVQPPSALAPPPASGAEALASDGTFTPRHKPPELSSNLSAMRDLANRNAREALDTHSRKQLKSDSTVTLAVA